MMMNQALLYLHDQGAVLVTVFIEGVQLCYRVVKCLIRTAMRRTVVVVRLTEIMRKEAKREREIEGEGREVRRGDRLIAEFARLKFSTIKFSAPAL